MKDLQVGMLVVGAVSLACAVIVVATTAAHLLREREADRRKVLLAACQVALLTPFGLLLLGYVYEWARLSWGVYAATGAAVFLACGAGLASLPRKAAR